MLLSNSSAKLCVSYIVLVPSEFTLLSNARLKGQKEKQVLVPIEFTLLSNRNARLISKSIVLVPSKFTLLSNLKPQIQTSNRERGYRGARSGRFDGRDAVLRSGGDRWHKTYLY